MLFLIFTQLTKSLKTSDKWEWLKYNLDLWQCVVLLRYKSFFLNNSHTRSIGFKFKCNIQ